MLFANQSQHFHLKQAPKIFVNTSLNQQEDFEIVITLDILDLDLIFENSKQIHFFDVIFYA